MNAMNKEKRFSPAVRVLGGLSVVLLVGVLVVVSASGFGVVSGIVLTASLAGLVVPCVTAGDSLLEVLGSIMELIAEGISTVAGAILDLFSSILG
jgi:hypothetical protein